MVFYHRMHQLMQEYVINQVLRDAHQLEVQIDVVGKRTASPAGFCIFYAHPLVVESMLLGQLL